MAKDLAPALHPEEFLDRIFSSHADLLARVSFPCVWVPPFQGLMAVGELTQQSIQDFAGYAAIAGIGQYSCHQAGSVSLLAHAFVHLREPVAEEIKDDLFRYGEQVVGDLVATLPAGRKYVAIHKPGHFADGCEYKGPLRWEKTDVAVRVVPRNIPVEDISSLTEELESISEPTGDFIRSAGYHLFRAEGGVLQYAPFACVDNFPPEGLKPHGKVEVDSCGHRMWYTAVGTTDKVPFHDFIRSF